MHNSFSRLIRIFSKPAWALYFNLGTAVSVSGGIIFPFLSLLALNLLQYLHQHQGGAAIVTRGVTLCAVPCFPGCFPEFLVLQGCEIGAPLPGFYIQKQQRAVTNLQLPKNLTPGGCA